MTNTKYYTLSEFRKEIFVPFNEAITKDGAYEKLEYKKWRNLNNWSKEGQYQQMKVERHESIELKNSNHIEIKTIWTVGPYDRNRIIPNPEEFSTDDNSFGSYLEHQYIDKFYNINKLKNNYEKEKNKNMKFGNFDFGPVDSSVRMSMYGMAIKNASGTYVAYDTKSNQVMDVDILNFEGANKFIYKMPVAMAEVRSGDVVIHARKPMFVQMVQTDGRLKVMDIFDGEEKTIVPARSPFGFDFMTKVVSLVNFTSADSTNPFGNLLPLMLLSDAGGKDNDNLMLAAAMMSGNNAIAQNPLMLCALMDKDSNMRDMLPIFLLGNCANLAQPAGCSGNCSCGKDKE